VANVHNFLSYHLAHPTHANVVAFHAMASLSPLLMLLWAVSILIQTIVLSLVISKRHFRSLPFFAVYSVLNLCQAAFLLFVYSKFGYTSQEARELYWISEPITLTAQALAAGEVLHRVLWAYAGIWGLAWRLIAAATSIVVFYAAVSAGKTPDWRLLIANRGFHLTFAVALVSCLVLVRFYSIPVDPVYKSLLGGFCFFSCTVVAADTLLQLLFLRRYPGVGNTWNYLEMVVFVGVQVVWAVALRQPIRAPEKPTLLPPSTYDRMSPEVNAGLRRLNEVLSRLWRLEALGP
jgi:hypothetical protein